MGDANASIPTPQPVLPRPMFAGSGAGASDTSVHFIAPGALDGGDLADRLEVARRLVPTKDTRAVGKTDLPNNGALPRIEVDPDTFTVRVEARLCRSRWRPSCRWPNATFFSER